MLIDIPVTITFNHENTSRAGGRSHSCVFTMRYDTVDTDAPAQWVGHFPPRPNAQWITDKQGVLFDLFTADADREIKRLSEEDPETYAVKAA